MKLVFLLEEKSMEALLDTLLPRILPEGVTYETISHNGKNSLRKSIPTKLRAWKEPGVKFVILHDQDTADCYKVKEELLDLTRGANRDVLVRIACQELESWYFGDLNAVSEAYGVDMRGLAAKEKYRIPDNIPNPKEALKRLIPRHQQITGAKMISEHMSIENNTSKSFQCFVTGIRKLASS